MSYFQAKRTTISDYLLLNRQDQEVNAAVRQSKDGFDTYSIARVLNFTKLHQTYT